MLIRQFISYLQSELRYAQNTLVSYENDLNQFQLFLQETEDELPLEKAETLHIRNFIISLSEQEVKAASINRKMAALKRFYKYLIKQDLIENSPAAPLKNLKNPKQVYIPFSEEELLELGETQWQSITDFQEFQTLAIIETLYQTGMRRNELIHLTWKDVNYELRHIKVLGKRNKERIIPISQHLIEIFQKFNKIKNEHTIESSYLFSLKNGKKLYPKFVYTLVKQYLSSHTSKEKKNPHMLRHTFASHILNNGAEINSVKELLGHSSLASTQVYTHQDIEALKKIFKENHPREINP